jgi:hypothetical protein
MFKNLFKVKRIKNSELTKVIQFFPFVIFLMIGLFGYVLNSINYFSSIPGDLGDARLNSVILEHIFRWVIGKESSLWSPTFFYPFEGVLTFSDNHFGSVFSYIFFRLLGLSREIAFDGWYLVGNCLNFIAAYLVLRRFRLTGFGSAAGAFVFAFALCVLPKEGHAQLTYRFAIPFAFFAIYDFLISKRIVILSRVAFWFMVQMYCSIYLGVFLLYLLVATFIAMLVLNHANNLHLGFIDQYHKEKNTIVRFSIFLLITSVAAVLWLLYQYYAVGADYKPGSWRFYQIPSMLPRFSSYLLADQSSLYVWLSKMITGIPMRHEHQMFVGVGVLILVVFGVFSAFYNQSHRLLGNTALFTILILFALTLSIRGHSLYMLIAHLPGISEIRAVSRIILVMIFPIALLVAIGSDRLLKLVESSTQINKTLLRIGVLILLCMEVITFQSKSTPADLWQERIEKLSEKLPENFSSNSILFVTKNENEPFYQAELDAMIFAQENGVPTLNGYSGSYPPGYMEPEPCYSFINRLNGYKVHRNLPQSTLDSIAHRVITVAYTPCGQTPVIASSGPISTKQIKMIKLSLSNLKVEHQSLTASIKITNGSSSVFNTTSNSGTPVRLSWRFVKISHSGFRLQAPGFFARQNLVWSLPPNTSNQADIHAELPMEPGNYVFEVSLVQDGVAWFHDLGMPMASVPINVNDKRLSNPVTAEQAKEIRLNITDVQQNSETLTANIAIINNSATDFVSVPIRYSWRFVSISPSGARVEVPSWDARKDIEWPVAAGKTKRTEIVAKLPSTKGRYYFELTLVQDGVVWLHDLGMEIPSVPINVEPATNIR